MSAQSETVDWRELWASGDLGRFLLHLAGHPAARHQRDDDRHRHARHGRRHSRRRTGRLVAGHLRGRLDHRRGRAAGRMISYIALRTNMAGAALIYAFGALICAVAPSMPWFLVGRLFEGFGGGALVALALVSVERLFSRLIWPQLFAIISVVWGVAAFSGPLIGAFVTETLSWRWAFYIFAGAGVTMAAGSLGRAQQPGGAAPRPQTGQRPRFPRCCRSPAWRSPSCSWRWRASASTRCARPSSSSSASPASPPSSSSTRAARCRACFRAGRSIPRRPLGNGLVMIAALFDRRLELRHLRTAHPDDAARRVADDHRLPDRRRGAVVVGAVDPRRQGKAAAQASPLATGVVMIASGIAGSPSFTWAGSIGGVAVLRPSCRAAASACPGRSSPA